MRHQHERKERRKKSYVMLQGHEIETHLNGTDHVCEWENQKRRIEVKILKGLKSQFHEFIQYKWLIWNQKGNESISLEYGEVEFHFSLSLY